MEFVNILLNVLSKTSTFVIILVPTYLVITLLINLLTRFIFHSKYNFSKYIALLISIVLILLNVKFLDVY